MAEEAKVTPEAETIAPKEGTVEAEIAKVEPKGTAGDILPKAEPETVPLSTYLGLKDDIKELKKELKETKDSKKPSVIIDGLKDLADKYPDVNKEFLQDLLSSATTNAERKIEEKYTPILERQDNEKRQAAFDKAFDDLYTKTLADNTDLPKDIDKDAIKALAITSKYRDVPLADILTKLYPSTGGKGSSENETRTAADRVDEITSFDKITPEQKKAIIADPEARKKYYAYLDSINR